MLATFAEILIISLARRPDRRAAALAQVGRAFPGEATVVLDAVDGQGLDAATMAARGWAPFPDWIQPNAENPFWARPLRMGEIGCALSHQAAWERIAALAEGRQSVAPTLVVEDDVTFAPGAGDAVRTQLAALATASAGWDLLYIGRSPLKGPESPVLPGVVVARASYCTFAYALTPAGAKKLLRARLPQAILPVDELLWAMIEDHPRADVHARFGDLPRLRALALVPTLADHAEDSETEGSAKLDESFLGGRRG